MPDSIEQIDTAALADEVVQRLDAGTVIDDKVILSRRQLVALAGSGLSAGALAALGVDRATAQAVGAVGTETDPVDVKAWDLDVQNGAQFNGNDLLGVGAAEVDEANIKNVVGQGRWEGGGSDQSIPDSTATKVDINQSDIEDSDLFDVEPSNDEITVLFDGKVEVGFSVNWRGGTFSSGDPVFMEIRKNGSRESFFEVLKNTDEDETKQHMPVEIEVNENDTFDFRVDQRSGESQDLASGSSGANHTGFFRVKRSG